eukprot:860573-Amphidinium_carterae.1
MLNTTQLTQQTRIGTSLSSGVRGVLLSISSRMEGRSWPSAAREGRGMRAFRLKTTMFTGGVWLAS